MRPDGSAFSTVHAFNGSDGAYPSAGVILAPDGFLYGTTNDNGANGFGTVFRVRPDGSAFSTLYAFSGSDGAWPNAGVILAPDGFLYGTTEGDGASDYGTVYRVRPDGSAFSTFHAFSSSDGARPTAGVILAPDGFLYGTTLGGGVANSGTVYRVRPDGSAFSTVHAFNGSDGSHPHAGVILAPDGFLYGTTLAGGASGNGTVYRVRPDGSAFSTLHAFSFGDGYHPVARVILAPDGFLYGTTFNGGASEYGTVYRVRPDGSAFSTLHAFSFGDGAYPVAGVILAPDGFLYGTTKEGGARNGGTVYRVRPDGSAFSTLHAFNGSDGSTLLAGVLLAPDGFLYGTTTHGGVRHGGTVYRVRPDGSAFSTVHAFNGSDGTRPKAGVLLAPDGFLYGTTAGDGRSDSGTVYRVRPDGSAFSTLHVFSFGDRAHPSAGVLLAPDGFLYGTTVGDGRSGYGTVYRVRPDGTAFSTLHAFSDGDSAFLVAAVILAPDGFLYGTTVSDGLSGYGTVFRVRPDGSAFSTLHAFSGGDGARPEAGVIMALDGSLFGTTRGSSEGGLVDPLGTVYRLVFAPGDRNHDGLTDCGDRTMIKQALGKRTGQPGFNSLADTNGDGVINVRDLAFVARQLPAGTVCP